MNHPLKFTWLAMFTTAAASMAYGCSASSAPIDTSTGNEGAHGEPCYPDNTCNAGLTCSNNLCVASGSFDGGQDTGTAADSSTPGDGSSGMDAGCSAPGKLYPPSPPNSVYCPFSATMGGKDVSCNPASQHCCEPTGSGTSTCTANGTACASGTIDWQCQDPGDCGSGMQCCGTGTFNNSGDPSCANYASGFKGTHCAASCSSSEIRMCSASAECGGKTCTPFKTHGAQVGGCE